MIKLSEGMLDRLIADFENTVNNLKTLREDWKNLEIDPSKKTCCKVTLIPQKKIQNIISETKKSKLLFQAHFTT